MADLVFEVTGMHCSNCGLLVDDAIEDVPGVSSSSTDVRAGRTVVKGAAAVPEILAAIGRTGYTGRLV
jgi:Cu+-exporting ATPase